MLKESNGNIMPRYEKPFTTICSWCNGKAHYFPGQHSIEPCVHCRKYSDSMHPMVVIDKEDTP